MQFRKLDRGQFFEAFDVRAQMIDPFEGAPVAPFKSAWGLVAPGERVKPHAHFVAEIYTVVQGRGRMIVDGESSEMGPGDMVYIDPFESHILENSSEKEDLLFLAIWWEDLSRMPDSKKDLPPSDDRRYLVIASPPTPNGYMHLGHLAGPYLSADFHARYLRLRGLDVAYISHTDDNESYIALKASQLGQGRRETIEEYASALRRALDAAGIRTDVFLRPSSAAEHVPRVEEIFRKLYDDGVFVEKEQEVPYCESCERHLFECFVIGKCPFCGAGADAFICERCFRPIDCTELVDPRCRLCDETPATRPFKRLVLPLGRFEKELAEYYRRADLGPCVRGLCERMLADGLPDIAMSHVVGWGTPVPVDGYRDQTIYGALEVLPAFLVSCERVAEERGLDGGWRSFYADDKAEVVQFFGSDNCYFFGVLYPALCLAFDPAMRMPSRLVTNEYLLLDGLKFSTTLGHLIGAEEMLAEVPADVLRFYLAYVAPETEQTDFRREEFEATVRRVLRGEWQAWLASLAGKVRDDWEGRAVETDLWTQDHRRFYQELLDLVQRAATAYDSAGFSPQKAARVLCEVVRLARRFGQSERHMQGIEYCRAERETGIALELLSAKILALLAAPMMPEFAGRLWRELGYGEPLGDGAWEEVPTWVPAGQRIGRLEGPYFDDPAAGDAR